VNESSITTLAGKLLDWPFLFFILILSALIKFRSEVSEWMKRVNEVKITRGTLHFKIGNDQVSLGKLDTTITARLRELQEEIESVRKDMTARSTPAATAEVNTHDEIPRGLEAQLVDRVYPMLGSKLWLGRYVQTLAKNASVSEDLMLKFCRSRNDIGLFKDGDRWVAALSDRLKLRG
jgi:hypothetical protein